MPFVGCDLDFYICLKSTKYPGCPQKWFKSEPGMLNCFAAQLTQAESNREAPIMEMLNHLPFCKNPEVEDRLSHHQINPGWFLPVRSLTFASYHDESSLLIKLTPRRKSGTYHTTPFRPIISTLAAH